MHVIALAQKDDETVGHYDILKSIFLADKSHLNEYGRPVTFDNYVAMRAGPVPSLAYDFLKEDKRALSRNRIGNLPWDRASAGSGRYYYSNPDIVACDGVLSDSDKDALSDAYGTVRNSTFAEIRELTHAEPAYIEAWDDRESRGAFDMSIGMLFDPPDFEQAEAVAFLSKHM